MIGRLFKLALLLGVVILLGLAVFRPATIFGVDAKGLANSLGGEVHHSSATCRGQGAGRYRCALDGEAVAGVEYELRTRRFGCWSGSRVAMPAKAEPVARSVSGCIGLADEFGQ